MKHTKLIIAGLTTVMMLGGATAVFADEIAGADDTTARQTMEQTDTGRQTFGLGKMGRQAMEQIDMSGLELPEGFVPFDEEHVPDGINVPENGELKPIEFDEDGKMLYGQKPEGMPGEMGGDMNGRFHGGPQMDGEHPEFAEGEMPEFDGERPEFAEGERPELADGERPEFAEGEMPEFDGERPEFAEGEMPEFGGERPEFAEGEMPEFDGERSEFDGEMGGRMKQLSDDFKQV